MSGLSIASKLVHHSYHQSDEANMRDLSLLDVPLALIESTQNDLFRRCAAAATLLALAILASSGPRGATAAALDVSTLPAKCQALSGCYSAMDPADTQYQYEVGTPCQAAACVTNCIQSTGYPPVCTWMACTCTPSAAQSAENCTASLLLDTNQCEHGENGRAERPHRLFHH